MWRVPWGLCLNHSGTVKAKALSSLWPNPWEKQPKGEKFILAMLSEAPSQDSQLHCLLAGMRQNHHGGMVWPRKAAVSQLPGSRERGKKREEGLGTRDSPMFTSRDSSFQQAPLLVPILSTGWSWCSMDPVTSLRSSSLQDFSTLSHFGKHFWSQDCYRIGFHVKKWFGPSQPSVLASERLITLPCDDNWPSVLSWFFELQDLRILAMERTLSRCPQLG